jgi:membrane protease YdiL (CAAX protease family)
MKHTDNPWHYVIVVFVLSYLWQLFLYFNGGIDSPFFPVMLLFPGVVAIAFRLRNKESFRNVGWGIRGWGYIIPSVMVPIIFILVVGGLLTTLNWATLSDRHFIFRDGMVEIQKIPLVLGNHTQGIAFFALNFVLSLLIQSLLGSIVTIGEEFGWRGYLQEKLLRKYGLNGGLILLGIIWGYWHLPIGLMGWNFPNHPVLGAFILTPLSTVFIGIFLGWLYLRSKSIWMPTLAHAAWNLCATLLLSELVMYRDDLYLQLTLLAIWGVLAGLCLISLSRKKPVLWQSNEISKKGEK